MKELIILGIILMIVTIIGESYLKKKYHIRRKENAMSQSVRRVQRIILGILFLLYLIASVVLIFNYEDIDVLFIIIPFIFVVSLFQAFMQWKYNRSANVWILEVFTVLIFAVFLFAIQLF